MLAFSIKQRRWALLGFTGLLLLLALWLPAVEQSAHYHDFADQRPWGALPYAGDVLSNLAFALFALWGGWQWWQQRPALCLTEQAMLLGVVLGLGLTSLGSSYYHLAPEDGRLWWDRLGMLFIFAPLLGLAVAERLDAASAWVTAPVVLLAGFISLQYWASSGNALPWALLQGGGMLLLLVLAFAPVQTQQVGIRWGLVIACYTLAKLLELGDGAVFAATGQWVSGHSLKHMVAALALWPVFAPRAAQACRVMRSARSAR